MAIALRANGTWIDSTANVIPVIPTGAVAGDIMICSYGTKPYSDAPTINNGWTLIGSATDGTVAAGIDVGSMKTVMWYKIHTGTETNPTITNTTNSVSSARIDVYSCTSGVWVTPVGSGGGDATAGTGFLATITDVGWIANDCCVIAASFRSDSAIIGGSILFGKVGGTGSISTTDISAITSYTTTTGQDMGMYADAFIINSFTATGYSSLNVNGTLNTAHTGSVYVVRLRENSPPTVVLNTPINGATAQSNTPTLSFTGTDIDSNTIEYNVEVDTVNTFNSVLVTEPFYLKYIDLSVRKYGSPTDDIYLDIRSILTGSNLATSDVLSASSLTTSLQWIRFTFTTPILIDGETIYYICLRRSSTTYDNVNYSSFASNYMLPPGTYTDGYEYILNNNNWVDQNTYTINFRLYNDSNVLKIANEPGVQVFDFGLYGGTTTDYDVQIAQRIKGIWARNPLYSEYSSIDTGFSVGHPFTSGTQQSFTIPTVLNGTTLHYWRARAIDPTGLNAWGAWSSVYSFTTSVGSPQYNESISLSSANSISAFFDAILVASITLSSDNLIVNTSIADLLAVANVSSVNQMSAINNLISDVSASLSSANTLSSTGGLDFSNVITLSSENAIVPLLELILNQSASLGIDTQVSDTANMDTVSSTLLSSDSSIAQTGIAQIMALISLSSDNTLVSATTLDINMNLSLVTDSQIVTTNVSDLIALASVSSSADVLTIGALISEAITSLNLDSITSTGNNISLNGSLVLSSDNAIVVSTLLDAAIEVSLTMLTDTQIIPIANINAVASALLQSDNLVSVLNTIDMNSSIEIQSQNILSNATTVDFLAQLSLQTDSSIADNNLTSYMQNIALLTSNNIAFTYDEFSTMVVDLVSISQMSIEESVTKLAQMQLQLNNDVLFGLVIEIYNQISIVSNAGLVTVAEVISIINSVLNLGASADSIYSCVQIFNYDYVDLRINAIINFIADLNRTDFSNNEILALKSLITSSFILKSSICDVLLNKSLLVEKLIFQNSLITSEIYIKSTITNSININSKIY